MAPSRSVHTPSAGPKVLTSTLFEPEDANPRSFYWADGVLEACTRFRQGDVVPGLSLAFSSYAPLAITTLARGASSGATDVIGVRTSLQYGMITSQTCDLSGKRGAKYPFFLVAPVYDIAGVVDPGLEGHIRRDRVGEFILLNGDSFREGLWIADLRFETSIEKGILMNRDPVLAFADEDGYLRCSRKIARVRTRAAIDDALETHLIRPLKRKFETGGLLHEPIVDILVKATPSIVQAKAARIYVLLTEGSDVLAIQRKFDDWHAEIRPSLPIDFTFLGVDVRLASTFTWLDYRGAELIDFSSLSQSEEES